MNGRSLRACASLGAELVDRAMEAGDLGVVSGRVGPADLGGGFALAPAGGRPVAGPGPLSPTVAMARPRVSVATNRARLGRLDGR